MKTGINWIKCSEDLPKKSGLYLAITWPGHIQHLDYSAKHKKWNVHDDDYDFEYEIESVSYWAEANFPEGYEGV